jgi:hypothetical protein
MAEGIEAQLEKIGRVAQTRGAGQRGGGSDHPHDTILACELMDQRDNSQFSPRAHTLQWRNALS